MPYNNADAPIVFYFGLLVSGCDKMRACACVLLGVSVRVHAWGKGAGAHVLPSFSADTVNDKSSQEKMVCSGELEQQSKSK